MDIAGPELARLHRELIPARMEASRQREHLVALRRQTGVGLERRPGQVQLDVSAAGERPSVEGLFRTGRQIGSQGPALRCEP